MKVNKNILKKLLLSMLLFSILPQANIFTTQHLKGYAEPRLSIIGDFAINQNTSSYEVFFDSDNDGDEDRLTVSTNADSSVFSTILSINDGAGNYIDSSQDFSSINLNNQTKVKLMGVYLQDLDNDGFIDIWLHTKIAIGDYQFSIDNSFIFSNKQGNTYELVNSFYTESYENPHTAKGRTLMIFEDINNDGLIDARFHNLYVHDFPAAQYQLVNSGNFQFSIKEESTLAYTQKVVALDYNSDGNKDIVTLSNIPFKPLGFAVTHVNIMESSQGVLWLSDAQGQFTPSENNLPINKARNMWVVDVNADDKDDVLFKFRSESGVNSYMLFFSAEQNNYVNSIILDVTTSGSEYVDYKTGVEVADLNNDGRQDIVISSGVINVFENIDLSSFSKVSELGSTSRIITNIVLEDMNNDGKIDVLGVETVFTSKHINVAYNQGEMIFGDFNTLVSGYNQYFVTTDVDLDGIQEIMVSPYSARFLEPSYILKRNNSNDYLWLGSDLTDVKYGEDLFYSYFSFIAEDMDNDGREDVVSMNWRKDNTDINLSVVMHEQNNRVEYYNNADIAIMTEKKHFKKNLPSFDVADFNNDGLKDVVVSGDGGISLMTQVPNPKVETMYYDPNHNGHGYSLENIGRDNLYYNAFFTYDDNGEPEWFLQLNKMKSTENGVQIYPINPDILKNDISYLYDFSSASAQLNNNVARQGFIQNDSIDEDSFVFNFGLNDIPTEFIQWNTKRLITREQEPANDFSGMWWAGVDDAGWGISLMSIQREDRVDLIAILFFYDGAGNPRWLIGDAENFIPSQTITLNMDMIKGYGRGQTPLELTRISAGQITLTLNEASQDITRSGSMSMNVSYPQGNQVNWVRNNIPFTMLSKPKN